MNNATAMSPSRTAIVALNLEAEWRASAEGQLMLRLRYGRGVPCPGADMCVTVDDVPELAMAFQREGDEGSRDDKFELAKGVS